MHSGIADIVILHLANSSSHLQFPIMLPVVRALPLMRTYTHMVHSNTVCSLLELYCDHRHYARFIVYISTKKTHKYIGLPYILKTYQCTALKLCINLSMRWLFSTVSTEFIVIILYHKSISVFCSDIRQPYLFYSNSSKRLKP